MISREEMQELASKYREPTMLMLGSHSALDAWYGARSYRFKSIIYTTRERAIIYLQNPVSGEPTEDLPSVARGVAVVEDPRDLRGSGWHTGILVLDKYSDLYKYLDDLVEFEPLQVPNRAFTVYMGGDEHCSRIEDEFSAPMVGSRRLLKMENRGIEKDYYWFAEQAGIPYPKAYGFEVTRSGMSFKEKIDGPLVLKAHHPKRRFERTFIFAADSEDMERKVEMEMKAGNLDEDSLRAARLEQLVLGPHANFNFFYSPLNASESWGGLEKAFSRLYRVSVEEARMFLSNELLSIDERRETILDGLKRLPLDVQEKIMERTVPSFEVTLHALLSIRESLLKDVLRVADSFLLTIAEHEPPGMIGAWCLQTLITWDKPSKWGLRPTIKMEYSQGPGPFGLYDAEGEAPMHIPVTQDLALRHGGGTNVHMGLGAQYSNIKYGKPMSTGQRIALEVKRALEKGRLADIVT